MKRQPLSRYARTVIVLNAMYSGAIALSTIFVSVYLWVNCHDFITVCKHHMAVFAVTPVVFLFSGWYSQSRDRLHVFRLGFALHVVFYGALLILRENSPQYAVWLGILLGFTWGVYWAGSNTLNFDVTTLGEREYFFGVLAAVVGVVNLVAPVMGGVIIQYTGNTQRGYIVLFAIVVLMFIICIGCSFLLPSDRSRRPYKIWRALFPGKDQRDWRLMMASGASLAGAWHIFPFLLGILMFMRTGNELVVGAFSSFQGLAAVLTAVAIGRVATPRTRQKYLFLATIIHVAAGCLMLFPLTVPILFLFALLRAISQPMFGILHSGLNLDIIAKTVEEPGQRIEYICAWEMPLGLGRIIIMLLTIGLYQAMSGSEYVFRIVLFIMCVMRIITYLLDKSTSPMREARTRAMSPAVAELD